VSGRIKRLINGYLYHNHKLYHTLNSHNPHFFSINGANQIAIRTPEIICCCSRLAGTRRINYFERFLSQSDVKINSTIPRVWFMYI